MEGWLTGDTSHGPGVSGTTSSANNVQNAMQVASEAEDRAYERSVDREDTIMSYNSAEAAKSRDWSRTMRQTAYQDTVKDMIAAGLNPVLAAKVGATSSSSGATASFGSSSAASSAGSVFGSVFSSAMSLLNTMINNETKTDISNAQIASNEKQTVQKLSTQMSIAQLNADTKITATQMNIDQEKWNTAIKNINDRELKNLEYKLKDELETRHPTNAWSAIWPQIENFIKGLTEDDNITLADAVKQAGNVANSAVIGFQNQIPTGTVMNITDMFSSAPIDECISAYKQACKDTGIFGTTVWSKDNIFDFNEHTATDKRYIELMKAKGYQYNNG